MFLAPSNTASMLSSGCGQMLVHHQKSIFYSRNVDFAGDFGVSGSFSLVESEDSVVGESGDAIQTVEPTSSYAYGSMVPIACSPSPVNSLLVDYKLTKLLHELLAPTLAHTPIA